MGKYYVGIEPDDCPENPLEHSDYELISFNRRHINAGDPEELGWFKNGPNPTPKLKKLMDKDLAFILSYYEHGNCLWQLRDAPHVPGSDCPWDSVSVAGLLIYTGEMKDAPSKELRVKVAQGLVRSYSEWANGEVYSWLIENKHGETIDSRCGLFGLEYAEQSLKEALSNLPQKKIKLADNNVYLDSVPVDVWQQKEEAA